MRRLSLRSPSWLKHGGRTSKRFVDVLKRGPMRARAHVAHRRPHEDDFFETLFFLSTLSPFSVRFFSPLPPLPDENTMYFPRRAHTRARTSGCTVRNKRKTSARLECRRGIRRLISCHYPHEHALPLLSLYSVTNVAADESRLIIYL